jgi:hypothetical protein
LARLPNPGSRIFESNRNEFVCLFRLDKVDSMAFVGAKIAVLACFALLTRSGIIPLHDAKIAVLSERVNCDVGNFGVPVRAPLLWASGRWPPIDMGERRLLFSPL